MNSIIEIDLVEIEKNGLDINEYLTLYKINLNEQNENIPFYSSLSIINKLQEKDFVIIKESDIKLSKKALKLFPVKAYDFDELYFLYPYITLDGRVLRSKNKDIKGVMTRDYKTLSKKYYSNVRTRIIHELVISATKKMVNDVRLNGKLNFLPKLETYINQKGWERYYDLKETGLAYNTEKL